MTSGSLNHEIFDPYNVPITPCAVIILALSQSRRIGSPVMQELM